MNDNFLNEPEARLDNQSPHINNKVRARMCRAKSVADHYPTPLTEAVWDSLIDSPTVAKLCTSISNYIDGKAAAAIREGRTLTTEEKSAISNKVGEWKKQLPVITPHAQDFGNGERKADNAIPNGLVMMDFDDHDYLHSADPEGLWQQFVDRGGKERWSVVLAHKTVSGRGLRIVFERPDGLDIREAQEAMADWFGQKAISRKADDKDDKGWDTSCTNLDRLSFVPPRSYIYFENREKMFTPVEVTDIQPRTDCQTKQTDRLADNSTEETSSNLQTTYDHLPLTEIAARWVQNRLGTTVIPVGQRNNTLHTLAYELTLITDNNARAIAQALKPLMDACGFSISATEDPIGSAVKARKEAEKKCRQGFPEELKQAIADVKKDFADNPAAEEGEGHTLGDTDPEQAEGHNLPPLAPVIKELVGTAPPDFKEASIIASLPLLGAVASNIRGIFNGKEEAPVFQVAIEGHQGCGKDYMAGKLKEKILPLVLRHDQEVEDEEKEYNSECKRTQLRPGQKLPEPPRKPTQMRAGTISLSELKQRASLSQGLIQLQDVSEIAELTQNRSRGSWANLTETYRKGFEGGELTQDFVNKDTFNGRTNAWISILALGTPEAVAKFYTEYDAENGTASRTIFGYIPDQYYKRWQDWGKLTPAQQRLIDQKIEEGYDLNYYDDGKVKAPVILNVKYVADAMKQWSDNQVEQAGLEESRARGVFQRRSAIIGFRAGMLAHWLYGNSRHKQDVIAFARWVAEYTLNRLLFKYGTMYEKAARRQAGYKQPTEQQSLVLNKLGKNFTRQELYNIAKERGNNSGRTLLYRLKSGGFIKEDPDNTDLFFKVE